VDFDLLDWVPPPEKPQKPEKPWTIGRRLLASFCSLIGAACLLGLTALSLAFAWHLWETKYAAIGVVLGVVTLRWVGLYGVALLFCGILAPFSATSPYADTGTRDRRSSRDLDWRDWDWRDWEACRIEMQGTGLHDDDID
jgi:hypothetical protein